MSFPRYPKYKPSGVEWLGAVPAGWEEERLRSVFKFSKGLTITKENLQDEGVPCVNYGEIHSKYGFRLDPEVHPLRCVDQNYLHNNSDALIQNGDFVFADTSEDLEGSGNFTYLRSDVSIFAGYHTIIARPCHGVSPLLLAFLFHSSVFRSQIQRQVKGVKVFSISQSILKAAKCFLPPLSEQIAIASFLDHETAKIDALIAEQERLIELLKEKRQAVISHAVTKGLDPTVRMKDSGVEWLGQVPEHWEVLRIAALFRESNVFGSEDVPILSVSIHEGVSDKELNEDEMDRKVTRSDDRSKYKKVDPDDLVYNMMRAWQGGFGTVEVCGMVSPAYIVAKPIISGITKFVEKMLRTPEAIEQIRRHSRGITDFRLRLYWDEFKNIKVAIPPKSEIDAVLSSILETELRFQTISDACEMAIALLQERRTALISAAVTGQIDVRGFNPAAA